MAAMALLAHQLMKHSQSGSETANTGSASGGGLGGILGGLMGQGSTAGGGGLGGMLGGLMGQGGAAIGSSGGMGGMLGGLLGGGALSGLGGLLGNLRSQGLERHVNSWVSDGENHPVAPHELERAFHPDELDEAARHAGTDRGTLLNEMSQMLPSMVDKMTPGGRVPQHENELGSGGLGGLVTQILGGGRR